MRICYITQRPLHESPAALAYTKALHRLDIPIDIVYRREQGETTARVDDIHTYYSIDAAPIARFSPTASWRFTRAVLQQLEQTQYDLIHVNSYRGCTLLPRLGKRLAPAWIVDIRTSNVQSSGWKSRIADRVTAFETRAFDHTLIHSQALGEHMLGNRPFTVVHPGAHLQRFQQGDRAAAREKLKLSPGDVVIVYTGALRVERTPLKIITTFARVAAKRPHAKLLVVGEGAMLPDMQAESAALGLAERTLFTGRVPFETVQDYVAAGDIGFAYVPVTPNFDFNPPLKTAEFLAAGLPTVATHTNGSRLYIQHEQNGLLAADDPDALAAAILRLIDEPDLAAQLAANAPQSVAPFDWQTIVEEQLLPVYQQYGPL